MWAATAGKRVPLATGVFGGLLLAYSLNAGGSLGDALAWCALIGPLAVAATVAARLGARRVGATVVWCLVGILIGNVVPVVAFAVLYAVAG
jgi:hypothetical protein